MEGCGGVMYKDRVAGGEGRNGEMLLLVIGDVMVVGCQMYWCM